MIRILALVIISVFCTAAAIYADCDLPTGGACSLEDLKKEQQEFSKTLNHTNYLDVMDDNYAKQQEKTYQTDLKNQMKTEPLDKLKIH